MIHKQQVIIRPVSEKRKSAIQIAMFFTSFFLFFIIFSQIYKSFGVPVGWDTLRSVTPKDLKVLSYSTAQKGSLVAISTFSKKEGEPGIYNLISYNRGEKFFPPRKIKSVSSSEHSSVLNPQTAVSGSGNIAIIWQDFSENSSNYSLYLTESDNKGKTWSNVQELNFGNNTEMLPVIQYDEIDRLHIIFHALNEDHISIYHTMRNGESFTEPVLISLEESKIRGAFFPSVTIDKNNVYVVWQGKENAETLHDDLYFTRSIDYGKTWTTPIRATFNEYDDNAPTLAVSGETLYLVYLNNEKANWELKFIRGLGYGEVWEDNPKTIVSTNVNCLSPHLIKEDRDNLRLFWHQNTGESESIMSCSYSIVENSFTRPEQISEGETNSTVPSTLQTGKAVISIWMEDNSLVSKSTDTYVAPPSISSDTHLFGEWSQFATADIQWKPPSDDSGIAGYATIVNREKYFDPTVQNIDAPNFQTKIPFLPDGISYFHIRAIDRAGNYSRTIHFPLLVSSNPLSTPEVVSQTHEDGKSSEKRDVQFRWKQDGGERIKGFYFSFTPESAVVPKEFTEDTSLSFKDLKDGRYFLTVRAVDKTGNPGRIATFELLIGDVKAIDAMEYERMARNIEKEEEQGPVITDTPTVALTGENQQDEKEEEEKEEFILPQKEIVILFDRNPDNDPSTLKFTIQYKQDNSDAPADSMFSYTVYKNDNFYTSGQTKGTVLLEDLPEAEYSVQAHGSYSYSFDGELISGRTQSISEKITLQYSINVPVDRFYNKILSNFITDWRLNSLFVLSLCFALLFSLGFFKIYYISRVFFTRLFQRMMLIFH